MVLKKSNSGLNSGATQRAITHAGISKLDYFYLIHERLPYILNLENYLMLTTDINMSSPEALKSLLVCLEEMFTYLGYDPPNLSHATTQGPRRPNTLPNSAKYITECSLHKNKMWLLPERITQMRADIDFLRFLTRNLDVRFHEVRDSKINTSTCNRSKSLKAKTITSSEIIDKSSESVKQQQMASTSRRKQTCHSRKMQRSALLSRKQTQRHEMQHSQEEEQPAKIGHLDIYVYAPYDIEARSAYYKRGKKYSGRTNNSRLKSSTKMNGRSKGRFPCRLGYCKRDLEVDTRDGIKAVYEDSADLKVFMDSEELNTTHMPKSQEINYALSDFFTVRRRRLKGDNKDRKKRDTANEENCAPLVNRIRHPKGSFLLVSEDEYHWKHANSKKITTPMSRQHNSNFAQKESCLAQNESCLAQNESCLAQNESCLTQITASEASLDIHTIENANAFELKVIDAFDRDFVLVSLVFSEEHEKLFSLSQEQKHTDVFVNDKYPMKFGNSLPACFVVDCNPNKMHTSVPHWRVLTGRRNEPCSDLWLVSVQDQRQTPTQTNQHLQKLTADYKKASFSISELIDLATGLDSRVITTTSSRTSQPVRKDWLSTNVVWRNMPLNIFTATDSCTVEEIANMLKEECTIDRKVPQMQTKTVESFGDSNLTQCGVCLMDYDHSVLSTSPIVLEPCSHRYCVCCWRAHIQHCVTNGANSITCMSTNCANVIDIATMSTILPYTLVHKWQAQVRNRRIDTSPYCRWCPNVACDRVAVSRSETLKEQFGKVITCVCQQCWCGSCQGDPHWPASCDQMAAYRKLLAKTNSMFTLSGKDVVFKVKVKQCPSCHYPIEKNEGCISIYCVMCGYNFCWNCLQLSHSHQACKETSIETTTHLLMNKLEINWYSHCVMFKKKLASLQHAKQWLQHLHRKSECSLILSLPVNTENEAAQTAALRAEECVVFLKQAYTFQESMHVLIIFSELSQRYESKVYLKRARCKMFRLDFITWRLTETILEKKLSHLCKVDKITTHLLHAGRNVMRELSVLSAALQIMSKDVDTIQIGELNSGSLIRHR
ncbi:hypothetical protein BsWGS_20782 [Bradybaena similaris]